MNTRHRYNEYETFDDEPDPNTYLKSWNDDGGVDEASYKPYEPGSREPDIVDVYREMLETTVIHEEQAEFLEQRIEDLLSN